MRGIVDMISVGVLGGGWINEKVEEWESWDSLKASVRFLGGQHKGEEGSVFVCLRSALEGNEAVSRTVSSLTQLLKREFLEENGPVRDYLQQLGRIYPKLGGVVTLSFLQKMVVTLEEKETIRPGFPRLRDIAGTVPAPERNRVLYSLGARCPIKGLLISGKASREILCEALSAAFSQAFQDDALKQEAFGEQAVSISWSVPGNGTNCPLGEGHEGWSNLGEVLNRGLALSIGYLEDTPKGEAVFERLYLGVYSMVKAFWPLARHSWQVGAEPYCFADEMCDVHEEAKLSMAVNAGKTSVRFMIEFARNGKACEVFLKEDGDADECSHEVLSIETGQRSYGKFVSYLGRVIIDWNSVTNQFRIKVPYSVTSFQ